MMVKEEQKYTITQIINAYSKNSNFASEIAGDIDVEVLYTRPWSLAYTNITTAKVTTTGNRSGWSINERTFSFCRELTDFLMIGKDPTANGVASYAFWDCTALTRVRLVGDIKYIRDNAFGNCKSLTDIYVSFAEGDIANAPWGATNATVHYNTVFDSNGNIIS